MPLVRRGANKAGAKVLQRRDELRTIIVPQLVEQRLNPRLDRLRAQVDRLLRDGELLAGDLAAFVHGEVDRRPPGLAHHLREATSLTEVLKDVKDAREREENGRR